MRNFKIFIVALGMAFVIPFAQGRAPSSSSSCVPLPPAMKVDDTWGGTRVGTASIETAEFIYISYYDKDRWLSVAQIDKCSGALRKVELPSQFKGWDSHNYITLALDSKGRLHVAGNMHVSPLIYARMEKPDDLDSLKKLRDQTGSNEARTTYPKFFKDATGNLIFTYRDGSSGNGQQIINRFDGDSWHRMLDKPLFAPDSASDHVNAYATDIDLRSDGFFHTAWLWRQTPNVETNFNVNYAKSRDLLHWEDAEGNALALPITPKNSPVVDKTGTSSGLFNNMRLSSDQQNDPIISYVKFDQVGRSQLYHARYKNNQWKIYQSSDWTYRWDPRGSGAIPAEISFEGVSSIDGRLTEKINHPTFKTKIATYDDKTMKIISLSQPVTQFGTAAVSTRQMARPRLSKNTVMNSQRVMTDKVRSENFSISWESMPADTRDRPRECRPQIASCDYKSELLLHSVR